MPDKDSRWRITLPSGPIKPAVDGALQLAIYPFNTVATALAK